MPKKPPPKEGNSRKTTAKAKEAPTRKSERSESKLEKRVTRSAVVKKSDKYAELPTTVDIPIPKKSPKKEEKPKTTKKVVPKSGTSQVKSTKPKVKKPQSDKPKKSEGSTKKQDDVLDLIKKHIRNDVRAGFDDDEHIIEAALELDYDKLWDAKKLRGVVEEVLMQEITSLNEDEVTWPSVTDFDRLENAFKALEKENILCRHHFSCCGGCGNNKMWDMFEADPQSKYIGYVYYHMQDTPFAIRGKGLMFNYESFRAPAEDKVTYDLAIGHMLCNELEKQGLAAKWNGTIGQRVGVSMVWQRRREPN